MNYKLRQTGQEVQYILDNAAIQHPIHTIESFVPTTKLANGVYCTEANTIVVVQDNGIKAVTIDPVNGTRYYQWQDGELPDSGEYIENSMQDVATSEEMLAVWNGINNN